MSVLVILEMDGDPDALFAASAELEARRPTSAVTARVIAPMEGGVVVCTVWESAAARDAYQSEPEHQEALRASGLMAAVTGVPHREPRASRGGHRHASWPRPPGRSE